MLFFTELLFSGMMLASFLAVLLAFFFPMNVYVEGFGIGISILGLVLGRFEIGYFFSFKKYYFWHYSFLIVSFLVVLGSSFSPFILDHFGYYIPSIKALDFGGIMNGIVNVQMVLAQNSFWHILQAFTNDTFDGIYSLNAFLLWVFVLFIFESRKFLLALLLPVFLLFAQSPSPDLPIYILAIYICYKMYFEAERKLFWFLLALSVFAFTIKPTVFWLPIFVIVLQLKSYNVIKWNHLKLDTNIFRLILFTFLLSTFYFLKNYYSSANFLFPMGDFYRNVEWKPNDNLIQQSKKIAVLKTFDFQYSLAEITHFSGFERFWNWLNLDGFKSLIHYGMVGVLVFFTGFSFFKKNTFYGLLLGSIFLKLVLVYGFSGQYRFMLDGILVLLAFLLLSVKTQPLKSVFVGIIASFLVIFGMSFPNLIQQKIPSFALGGMLQGFEFSQILKPKQFSIGKEYKTFHYKYMEYHSPTNYPLLLDTPFPAISEEDLQLYDSLHIFPIYNGKTWKMKVKTTEKP